jgi:hypothetical protein
VSFSGDDGAFARYSPGLEVVSEVTTDYAQVGRLGIRPPVPVPGTWVTGAFAAGDALIFQDVTVHWALPNRTREIRMSFDGSVANFPSGYGRSTNTSEFIQPTNRIAAAETVLHRGRARRDVDTIRPTQPVI